MPRYRPRLDASQPAIVKALRAAGAVVTSLAMIGRGVPDILVSWQGRWFLAEIKDGEKAPSQRQLTEDEVKWIGQQKAKVHVIQSVEEAVEMLNGT